LQGNAAFHTAYFARADASRVAAAAAAAAALEPISWRAAAAESLAEPDVLEARALQVNATGVLQSPVDARGATDAGRRSVAPGLVWHGGAVLHPPPALIYVAAIFLTLAIYVAILVRRTRKANADAPELRQPEDAVCV
jgi:hypothetical protein